MNVELHLNSYLFHYISAGAELCLLNTKDLMKIPFSHTKKQKTQSSQGTTLKAIKENLLKVEY